MTLWENIKNSKQSLKTNAKSWFTISFHLHIFNIIDYISISLLFIEHIYKWFLYLRKMNITIRHIACRWTELNTKHWVSEWFNESVNKWVNESVNKWVNESVNMWVNEPVNMWVNESVNKLVSQWTGE